MKIVLVILSTAIMMFATSSWAAYVRMAECYGRTDQNRNARLTIFVNDKVDTEGTLVVSLDNGADYVSDTKVNWSTSDGYPRFYDNDFDLDIVINDKSVSFDDVLIENQYISRLECSYSPVK